MGIEGQLAVVTGGGRGLGKAIALQLARDGADLILAGPVESELVEAAAEIESVGRRAVVVLTDVSREQDVARLAEQAVADFGRIDILINNAGIIGPTAEVPEVSRDDWDEVLAVNLTGAFLCAKYVAPVMIKQRRGRIINIASIAGKLAYPLRSPYAVSKWGLIGLTLTLAGELGRYDVQVNAVCPGPVDGERMQTVFRRRAEEIGQSIEEVEREYTGTTLLGRLVQTRDIAAMTGFLASDQASNITGQAIDVSAGYGI